MTNLLLIVQSPAGTASAAAFTSTLPHSEAHAAALEGVLSQGPDWGLFIPCWRSFAGPLDDPNEGIIDAPS